MHLGDLTTSLTRSQSSHWLKTLLVCQYYLANRSFHLSWIICLFAAWMLKGWKSHKMTSVIELQWILKPIQAKVVIYIQEKQQCVVWMWRRVQLTSTQRLSGSHVSFHSKLGWLQDDPDVTTAVCCIWRWFSQVLLLEVLPLTHT